MLQSLRLADVRALLLFILNIIKFEEDKEKFITEFFDICFYRSLTYLTSPLSEKKQKDISDKISSFSDPMEITKYLNSYFGEVVYQQALLKGFKDVFDDFLLNIDQMLTLSEKQEIRNYFLKIIN